MSEINNYIEVLDDDLAAIVVELRALLLSLDPDIKEAIKWNSPTYSINKGICSIMAHKSHVNLQIFRGAEIADVALLSGTGKGMRHLQFHWIADLDKSLVQCVMNQAIEIDRP